VHKAPKKPAASPEKKTVAASAHSSPVTTNRLPLVGLILRPRPMPVEPEIAAMRPVFVNVYGHQRKAVGVILDRLDGR
jgi:hypothetical protein